MISTNRPQTNGQVEWFNKTIIGRLEHYVSEHLADWDRGVQPLTYAHNTSLHQSTGTTPFSSVLSLQPWCSTTAAPDSIVPNDMTEPPHPPSFCSWFLRQLGVPRKLVDAELATAQSRDKCSFDRTFLCMPQFWFEQRVLFDRSLAQTTESTCMANALLKSYWQRPSVSW